jgi:hypothetical protein
MNEQQLAAVKQALEALESERDKYLEWGDEDGAPEDVYEAITALQSIISQDALDKKAENARELGLSYDPAHDIVDIADIIAGELGVSRGTAYDMMREALKEAQPAPTVQEPWVGLTDEEIQTAWDEVMDGAVFTRREVYKVIEAKLKEKNI